MYILPAIALPRAFGSLIYVIGRRRFHIKKVDFLCSAAGLILGQGISSLSALVLKALGVQGI